MHFLIDENVPRSVADRLESYGHQVSFVTYIMPTGSADPIVATVSEELAAVLVSLDGDFEKIAPRVAISRRRFRRLSRVWLRCNEPQAASRMESAISLIESEFELAQTRSDRRMIIWLGNSYIRIQR